MKERMIKLALAAIPKLAKGWDKLDGKKTWLGVGEIGLGVLAGLFVNVGLGASLVVAGVQQTINGVAHKSHKINNKRGGK